MNIKSY